MKIGKKAVGTASSYLIASLVGLTLLIVLGGLVRDISKPNMYDVTYIDHTDNTSLFYDKTFATEYEKGKNTSDTYIGDYDTDTNESGGDRTTTEDSLFLKAFEIVSKSPAILRSVTSSVGKILAVFGIPEEWKYLVITTLGILLITLLVKIIRGFIDV